MKIETNDWKPFFLHRLYDIRMGNKFDKNKLDEDSPEVNLVSRVSYNNGVDVKVGYVDGVNPFPAGLVTVALGGSYLGSCFVQEEPFYTAQNVAVMKPKQHMTHAVNLFISGLVRYEAKVKYYAFGRELNTHIKTDFDVKLPIQRNTDGSPIIDESLCFSDDGYVPDWQFMENYIKSLHHKPLTTQNKVDHAPDISVKDWKYFKVGRLFHMKNGKGITQEEINENEGSFIAVQSGEDNNGVMGKIDLDYCKTMGYTYSEKPCLTVARSGTAGFVSFQSEGCVVGDSAKLLLLDDDVASIEIYLFLQTVLSANRFKYTYGRKVTEEKYMNEWLKLPAKRNASGEYVHDDTYRYSDDGYVPDWQFMKNYIKSLPYGDRLEG